MKRLIQAVKEVIYGKPLSIRSPQWDKVRKNFLKDHQACVACGRTERLEVHHIKPFHLYKELELDPNNLMTLCENTDTKCHLMIGHNGHWKRENVNVIADATSFYIGYKLNN